MSSNKKYQILINILLVILTLFMVLPILLLFMSSITEESTLIAKGYSFFPKKFSVEGYAYILKNKATILSAYGYTIGITAVGTVVSVLVTMLMAFPLSIRKLPGRSIFSFYVLFTMLFSGGIVPSYIMWTSTFHIKNTLLAYLLPGLLMNAMNIILMRTFYMNSIPESLYEAAEIDGAGYLTIFWKIVIPLGKPIMVTIAMFTGLGYWNDWVNGLYYINDKKLYTIQVLLNNMIENIRALQTSAGAGAGSVGQIPAVSVRMAIAFVALAPILAIYPFLQKYFASGIMMGAVKG
ncbi:MAG: carbohydrate ABC transporter permease [Roseburia sp.]|jgi:putative aldouronate transport system permease protein|nr:carbohydrate ABC transporter permease [Roseburia sp.]